MLMTEAPASIAFWTPVAEAEQVSALEGSGMFSARAPGQTPTMPTPLTGAAATAAVAVPCSWSSGRSPSVVVRLPPNSGCVSSSRVSSSAISGLVSPTGGGARFGSAIAARQAFGGPDSGSLGTACLVVRSALGCAYSSRPRLRSAPANARA